MEIFNPQNLDIVLRLFVALVLGSLLGFERAAAGKKAGARTYALVGLGSALFVVISTIISGQYLDVTNFDPLRMASQVVVGIGFIGAGLIIFKGDTLKGVTTAAGLWVAAGIGVACGFALYNIAVIATLLTLFVFIVLWFIEDFFGW